VVEVVSMGLDGRATVPVRAFPERVESGQRLSASITSSVPFIKRSRTSCSKSSELVK
jgi:hypothetical protein